MAAVFIYQIKLQTAASDGLYAYRLNTRSVPWSVFQKTGV